MEFFSLSTEEKDWPRDKKGSDVGFQCKKKVGMHSSATMTLKMAAQASKQQLDKVPR